MNQPLFVQITITVALIFCCYTDIKHRLIKNYVTFPMMLTGIIVSTVLFNWHGLTGSLLGIVAGYVLGLVLTMVGALSFGDVKLFMGVGAFFGAYFVTEVVLISIFAAIPVAFALQPKEFLASLRNIYLYIKLTVLTRKKQILLIGGTAPASIPYAICILLGYAGAIISKGDVLSWLI